MKVITGNPIITNGKHVQSEDMYLSLDGNNSAQVRAFQMFANSKGDNLKVDGVYDVFTKQSYAKYGSDFERVANQMAGTVAQTIQNQNSGNKKGKVWDKIKGAYVDSGTGQQVGGILGGLLGNVLGGNQNVNQGGGNVPYSEPIPEGGNTKQGMNKGLKIALIVGGIAVVGFIIYKVVTKKK